MRDVDLADDLAAERGRAARLLLRNTIIDIDTDQDDFLLVARHASWLVDWFETTCGWRLTVDSSAGFARLAKRAAVIDATRPLRRPRGSGAPFDRRRYQLLCLLAAQLVAHPVTTIGTLARAIQTDAGFDSGLRRERSAFVDALLTLQNWGAVTASAGRLDDYVDDPDGNALLQCDTARLHRLLVGATAPSSLAPDVSADDAIAALLTEPRYGDASASDEPTQPDSHDAVADSEQLDTGGAGGTTGGHVSDEQQMRWIRHTLGRRLADDPVMHVDELSPPERRYVEHPSGRRWLRQQMHAVGFHVEERAEGWIAIDPESIATDSTFPGPHGNAAQLALLLIDELVVDSTTPHSGTIAPERTTVSLGREQIVAFTQGILDRFPKWARSHRVDDGPRLLGAAAVDVLVAHRLVTANDDGSITARPAIARYLPGEATEHAGAKHTTTHTDALALEFT